MTQIEIDTKDHNDLLEFYTQKFWIKRMYLDFIDDQTMMELHKSLKNDTHKK